MSIHSNRFMKVGIGAATAFAAVLGASCASLNSPKQIDASNPTVTYKYHNDDELVQTNELAAAFCSRYQAVPRSTSFIRDGAGDDVVVYECVSTSRSPIYASDFNPNMTYTYRTDQELLTGSQSAQAYCLNNGSSRVVSNINRIPTRRTGKWP